MNISDFISKIEHEIEELPPGTLKPETDFRNMEQWNSMMGLIFIALIDAEYNVTINGEDLKNAKTVNDLFDVVKSKIQ